MPKRQRDYKAEEARRNERARAAGFTSRAQERRVRRESHTWSRLHANKPVAYYQPGWSSERVRAYHEAFVKGPDTFATNTKTRRGSDKQRRWLVDISGWMTDDEYEDRYHLR